ncbi:DUF1799 domain-containing protein [Sagittula sp. NFXS13]|uniref:DUF1799 domain-containing protein n=1 Tax=Sagittula sp. NFXS13 TaxID=2819095 RepID=UPI0032DE9DED
MWPEHLEAMDAFLAINGQWRVAMTMTGTQVISLDYGAAESGLRLAGITTTPELWQQIRIIEQGAKAALNGE